MTAPTTAPPPMRSERRSPSERSFEAADLLLRSASSSSSSPEASERRRRDSISSLQESLGEILKRRASAAESDGGGRRNRPPRPASSSTAAAGPAATNESTSTETWGGDRSNNNNDDSFNSFNSFNDAGDRDTRQEAPPDSSSRGTGGLFRGLSERLGRGLGGGGSDPDCGGGGAGLAPHDSSCGETLRSASASSASGGSNNSGSNRSTQSFANKIRAARVNRQEAKRTALEESLMKQLARLQELHERELGEANVKLQQRESAIQTLEKALSLQTETLDRLRDELDETLVNLKEAETRLDKIDRCGERKSGKHRGRTHSPDAGLTTRRVFKETKAANKADANANGFSGSSLSVDIDCLHGVQRESAGRGGGGIPGRKERSDQGSRSTSAEKSGLATGAGQEGDGRSRSSLEKPGLDSRTRGRDRDAADRSRACSRDGAGGMMPLKSGRVAPRGDAADAASPPILVRRRSRDSLDDSIVQGRGGDRARSERRPARDAFDEPAVGELRRSDRSPSRRRQERRRSKDGVDASLGEGEDRAPPRMQRGGTTRSDGGQPRASGRGSRRQSGEDRRSVRPAQSPAPHSDARRRAREDDGHRDCAQDVNVNGELGREKTRGRRGMTLDEKFEVDGRIAAREGRRVTGRLTSRRSLVDPSDRTRASTDSGAAAQSCVEPRRRLRDDAGRPSSALKRREDGRPDSASRMRRGGGHNEARTAEEHAMK